MTDNIKSILKEWDKQDRINSQEDKKLREQNIAYDFDGVLHRDVFKPVMGYRMPTSMNPPFTPFVEIIDRMKRDYSRGHNIFIITARINNNGAIKAHLIDNGITFVKGENIIYTKGGPKVIALKEKRINVFYDDSCGHINNIVKARKEGNLPDLKRLYLVKPEDKKYYLVDNDNVDSLC